jgi:hypothetical protein
MDIDSFLKWFNTASLFDLTIILADRTQVIISHCLRTCFIFLTSWQLSLKLFPSNNKQSDSFYKKKYIEIVFSRKILESKSIDDVVIVSDFIFILNNFLYESLGYISLLQGTVYEFLTYYTYYVQELLY